MYGSETAAIGTTGSGGLAMAGVSTGSTVLAVIGIVFLTVALISLFRRHQGEP